MQKYNLTFIKDTDLFYHVQDTIKKYKFRMSLKDFNQNIIDPIKLTFDSKVYQKKMEDIIDSEIARQIDKSNNNHIGYFQQNIFKYLYDKHTKSSKRSIPKTGFDIENQKDKIFVEMKNKHNTMNSSSSQKTFITMQNKILEDSNNQCFLVEVIAKNSQNIVWEISIDEKKTSHPNIRRISIDKFYEIVTGEKTAFKQLVETLPIVMDDVLKDMTANDTTNTVLKELKDINHNILHSLYLSSFKTYEGFDSLNITDEANK